MHRSHSFSIMKVLILVAANIFSVNSVWDGTTQTFRFYVYLFLSIFYGNGRTGLSLFMNQLVAVHVVDFCLIFLFDFFRLLQVKKKKRRNSKVNTCFTFIIFWSLASPRYTLHQTDNSEIEIEI